MINDIISKLEKDSNCELSIEELKVLYEIDTTVYCNLSSYRDKRNNYEDFSKMFDKKNIACTSDEVNENTICYIGDLLLEYEMYTHNIRYVYGDIISWYDSIRNLENLEIVYIDAMINFIDKYEGLDNLKMVGNFLELNYIQEGDLSNVEYVKRLGLANVESLKNIKFPSSVERIYFKRLLSSEYFNIPNKLKYISIPREI